MSFRPTMITRKLFYAVVFAILTCSALQAQIGLAELRSLDPTLTGSGVSVAQPEAISSGTDAWQVNPATTGQPTSLFTYTSAAGTASTFPNGVGTESGHADTVGDLFYGNVNTSNPEGVAPGVSHVDNYEAGYFFNTLIASGSAIAAKVVNQSFVFTNEGGAPIQDEAVDQDYDNYVALYKTIFVSGAGNGGAPNSPSTAYNSISVGAYGGSSSTGPTTIGSRSKPDITAPAGFTSFSAPLVAGAAAILVQAGDREDGGAGTATAATDSRTVKALLLNGAVKQTGWTHTATAPLDTQQGAGLLNVFNSYKELVGGEHTFITSGTSQTPPIVGGSVSALDGWNFSTTLTSSAVNDAVEHYFFDLSAGDGSAFTLTSTLVWERQLNKTKINNLDLFLYTAAGTLVDSSVSTVDNVEHLFTQNLAPGRYDLEVVKHAGTTVGLNPTAVSNTESYALAFKFSPVPEPSSYLMIGIGAAWLIIRRRRR